MDTKPTVITLKKLLSLVPMLLLLGVIFLWFPFFSSSITMPRLLLLIAGSGFIWLFSVGKQLIKGKLTILITPLTITTGMLSGISFINLLFRSDNYIEALLDPFGFSTFFSLYLLSSTMTTPLSIRQKTIVRRMVYIFVSIAVSMLVLTKLKLLTFLEGAIPELASTTFSPLGSGLGTMGILVISGSLLLEDMVESYKHHRQSIKWLSIFSFFIIVGIMLYTATSLPSIFQHRFGISDSFRIMKDSYSTPLQALLGIGTDKYIYAFTQYRPEGLTLTPFWNTRVSIGGSLFFHLATTLGIGILGVFAYILFVLIKSTKSISQACINILIIGTIFFIQPSLSLTIFIYIVIMLNTSFIHKKISVSIHTFTHALRYTVVFPITLLLIGFCYIVVRTAHAEVQMYRANQAVAKRDGTLAYQAINSATELNPYMSSYHHLNSQIQATLAFNLLTNQNSATIAGRKNVLPEDAQLGLTFASQAINEAKAATKLAPSNVLHWEYLAELYSDLIGIADGAGPWSVAAYQQAITLDPHFSLLRANYAQTLLRLNNSEDALRAISEAITLQPNTSNFYVTMGNIYKNRQELQEAKEAYQKAANLLPPTMPQKQEFQTMADQVRLTELDQKVATPSQSIPTSTPTLNQ